jgi:hypothetical protein
MKNENISRDGSPGCHYIEFGARACYKEEVPQPNGRELEGGPS